MFLNVSFNSGQLWWFEILFIASAYISYHHHHYHHRHYYYHHHDYLHHHYVIRSPIPICCLGWNPWSSSCSLLKQKKYHKPWLSYGFLTCNSHDKVKQCICYFDPSTMVQLCVPVKCLFDLMFLCSPWTDWLLEFFTLCRLYSTQLLSTYTNSVCTTYQLEMRMLEWFHSLGHYTRKSF